METVLERESLLEWLVDHHGTFGVASTDLHILSDKTGLGTQFAQGFGGIGAVLRWEVDFDALQTVDDRESSHGEEPDGDEKEEDEDEGGGFDDDGDWGF
jgi:peptide chain release factor subunit 1